MQDEVGAAGARRDRRPRLGHALARPRRRGARPARGGGLSPWSTCPGAPASPPTSTPTAATARRAGRLAGLVRLHGSPHVTERARRDRGRARRRAPAHRRRRAGRGRDADEVTPGRGHQVLPGLRRPAPRRPRRHRRRREPPPGGRGQGRRVRRPRPQLALHRRPAEQQGGRGRGVRRRGGVRRPRQAARPVSRRGAHERSHDLDVLLQVSLDPPGAEGRPVPATRDELADLAADRRAGAGCSGCAG